MRFKNEFEEYAVKHHNIGSLTLDNYVKSQEVNKMTMNPHIENVVTPNIVEERPMNMALMDVFSRLMMDNIIWCAGPVDTRMSTIFQAQLLFLSEKDPNKPITVHIDSPGGSVMSGLAMVDLMNYVPNNIQTINTGLAASMGSVLLGAGTKGMRSALPFSRTMIHQVSSGASGHVADNRISHIESEKYNYVLFNMLADFSDNSFDEVMAIANRDKWFNAEEIKKFGLVDEVIYPEDNKKGMDKYLEGFDKYYDKLLKEERKG